MARTSSGLRTPAEAGRRIAWARWSLVVPALAAFAAYLPVLGHDLVWDDIPLLRDVPLYRVPELWRQALARPLIFSSNYFRPLAVLTFLGEMRLGGGDPPPALFHLTNLILHAANTAFVTLLAGRIGLTLGLSLAAGLIYGLHPALVEPVAFVSCRFDLLMTTFLLAALLADATLAGARVRPLAIGGSFLLAALAKEMAVALVVVLPLWQIALGRGLKAARASLVAVFAAGTLVLVLRRVALGHPFAAGAGGIPAGNGVEHLLLVARSLGEYLAVVLWPFTTITPLHVAELPLSARDAAAWGALIKGIGLVALVIGGWRLAPRAASLLLAAMLALLPVVNIIPLDLGGGAFVAERFLVFPLAFFTLSVVAFCARRPVPAALGRLVLGAWLLASLVVVERTLPRWRDDQSLWTWGEKGAPRSATPPTNLARYAARHGDFAGCLAAAERAVALDSRADPAWNLKGHALMQLGRHAEAETAFERAVELRPDSGLYRNNVAGALIEEKRYDEAERILLTDALPRDPLEPAIHSNLGILYLLTGRPRLAVPHLVEALRLVPQVEKAEAEELLRYAQSQVVAPQAAP